MPIKNPNHSTCQLTTSEIALQFTNYLINNKFLKKPGNMPKEQLIQLFDFYKSTNNTSVKTTDILSILDEAHLLKRRYVSGPNQKTHFVEFKPIIFETDLTKPLKFMNKLDPSIDQLKCTICKLTFRNYDERTEHEETDIHVLRDTYRRDRKSFPKKMTNIEITPLPKIRMDINEFKIIEITVKNVAKEPYAVEIHDVYQLVHLNGVQTVYVCPRVINNGEVFKLVLQVQFAEFGAKIFPVVLKVSVRGSSPFKHLLIEPLFDVIGEDLEVLNPTEPYRPVAKNKIIFTEAKVIGGIKLPSTMNGLAPKVCLAQYKIPETLNTILDHGFQVFDTISQSEIDRLEQTRLLLCDPTMSKVLHNMDALTDRNYVDRFHLLMWIEEHQAHKDMQAYNQIDVDLILARKKDGLYGIDVPGLSEGRPSVLKGDIVYIRRKRDTVKYEGVVHAVEENTIFVCPNQTFKDSYIEYEKVDIEFAFNRHPLRLCHRALDQLKVRNMTGALFPQIHEENSRKIKLKPMFNKLIAENKQQSQAVRNIVENRAYPAPYILFGPPGTGKTATLVEAISQVWSIFDRSRICVCAPSNSAADVITERLLEYISPIEIMRLYGMSRADNDVSENLLKCSNFDRFRRELFIPSENQIRSKRIVVITPVTAGRLVNAGIKGGFFDYVFMDEAGHAVEVEMLIPIVGFLTKPRETKLLGSLVLAGDPKQLGPIVRSSLAITLGFDISLLERVMSQCKLYEKNPEYNPKVITKLINNYRSHKEILHIPNICFYDNELKEKGPIEKITCAKEWKELNDANFPMIFHGVVGLESRESTSPSYFNLTEIQIVKNYVESLLGSQWNDYTVTQKDIGIITPYRKQVQKIRQYLKMRNWDDIDVASVEEFQGQERLIIIISTVRSRFEFVATDYQFGLGFLRNAKRFNVALTRAIALLIVIGNPDILQCDPNWRKLIEYCILKNSYKGVPPSGSVPKNFDPNEKLALDLSALTKNADLIPADEKPGFSRND